MMRLKCSNHCWAGVATLAIAVLAFAPAALAQVTVTIDVTGDAVPGGTVTATATVDITDGSTLQSIAWTQFEGVEATLTGADTATVTVALPDLAAYKAHLFVVLAEPPIGEDELPPNVPPPEGEFPGGLQNRFGLVGMSPFALEKAGAVGLEATVVTSSGTYHGEEEIVTTLPWKSSTGVSNVPVGVPALLHGKAQTAYDWALTAPSGSTATLADATGQNPELTPDVAGHYTLTVTDEAAGAPATVSFFAGNWVGVITGQDENGRPVSDATCTACHNNVIAPDTFSAWAQTGHAEIFSSQIDTSTHYSESCMSCHTVGFDKDAANNGIDDAADYAAFVAAGLFNVPGDNWTTILAQYPATARLANIQCENCHGPQGALSGAAHMSAGNERTSLSSDVCGACHGEPARHGRFQQWQLSGHANYELAIGEGESGGCARCHTANGFLAWGEIGYEQGTNVTVDWTPDQTHPQTCVSCHDPHSIGTISGDANNASVRIMGDTPVTTSGYAVTDAGTGAVCMVCHSSRRGLRNDSTWNPADASRAPHTAAQTDVLMGENAYLVEVGQRSWHGYIEKTCVTCHMHSTPPPDLLSYNLAGTNHTFYASDAICADCHQEVTAAAVQGPVQTALDALEERIEDGIVAVMDQQIRAGGTIDVGGAATITAVSQISQIHFLESHGRQGISVVLSDGTEAEAAMNAVMVVPASGDPVELYSVADPVLPKSGWNYFLIHSDGSLGVHNPSWVSRVLEESNDGIEAVYGGGTPPDNGGVSCTSPFVAWTEIATHAEGLAGSIWRTDVVAYNVGSSPAALEFILHANSGNVSTSGSVDGAAQGVFEDIVGTMAFDGKGALEICSTQPIEVVSRVYNQAASGTFGQFLDSYIRTDGLTEGESARLFGLRQQEGVFRTNISVTNTGLQPAEVAITLFGTNGGVLHEYTLEVASGRVVQDLEPFKARANQPELGWGFASVEVVAGNGILTSASVIDSRTNDATTIAMKK